MKRSFLCLVSLSLLSLMMSFSSVMGQNIAKFVVRDASLKQVIQKLESETKIGFFYEADILNKVSGISLNVENISLSDLLDKIFKGTDFKYELIDNNIVIKKSANETNSTLKQQPQKTTYTITVIDADTKKPIPGALVLVKGTNVGGICNQNGVVIVHNLSSNLQFEISCVGMKTKTKTVTATTKDVKLTIELEKDVMTVEDVVVTGYQRISKERATGSYDAVNKEQLSKPSTSLEQRLIGAVSGLQIVNKGYFERDESIVIRGVTSLGANSNPLIIVDGFAIEGSLSSINPNDIDNITVLKDAAAASIWGARSANGVIVVTTKSATKGKTNVEVNAFVKISSRLDLDYANPLASSRETVEYEKMGFATDFFGGRSKPLENNYTSSIYYSYERNYSQAVVAMNENRLGFLKGDLNQELERLSNLDNRQQIQDYLLQRPIVQQYNVNISGGSEKLSNVLTLMFEETNPYFKGNNAKKYSVNYRANLDLFKWLTFSFSSMFQYDNNKRNGIRWEAIQELSPYDMLIDENGDYLNVQHNLYMPIVKRFITDNNVEFPYSNWNYNPVQEIASRNIREKSINARFQAGLNFKLLKGLTFDSKIQYEIINTGYKGLFSEDSYDVRFGVNQATTWDGGSSQPIQNTAKGQIIEENKTNLDAYNFRNQLSFDRTFGKHNVSVIAGTEVSNRIYELIDHERIYGYNDLLLSVTAPLNGTYSPMNPIYDMFGDDMGYSANTSINYPSVRRKYTTDRFFSLYANGSYTYDTKYTISGSFRTDASNLISSDPSIRYSPFWSVGASWQIAREGFMKDVKWVDRLVLRSTYGFNGNVDKSTSVEPLISVWGQNPDTGTGYGVISNYGNPSLGWEKTGTFNIGVDYDLFGGKLNGKIDYYNKQGRDLISEVALANVYGTDSQSINAVSMYNKGIELVIGTNLTAEKFSWNGSLSFAYNKNKITKLFKDDATLNNRVYGAGSGWEYTEGYDSGTIWGFTYGGMQNVGGIEQPVIVDKNGENPRALNTYTTSFNSINYLMGQGTAVPPYVLGFNNTFRYGDLSLSFVVTGYFGHKFKRLGFNYPTMSTGVGAINKYYSEVINGDPNEFMPIPVKGSSTYNQIGSYNEIMNNMIVNAANIRFQEINLTYDFPARILNKVGLSALSVYGQLNDIGVITFNGYKQDPFYPMGTVKPGISYTFGLKFKF